MTGGAGFIGAGIVQSLRRDGHEVVVTKLPDTNVWRLNSLRNDVEFIDLDLSNGAQIEDVVAYIKPTHIYHCAAYGGRPHEVQTDQIYAVNFHGSRKLIEACERQGFDFFLNIGSSSEYGQHSKPFAENCSLHPLSDYAVAKAATTAFCEKKARFDHMPIYTVRPFSVYGPQEMAGRLMTDLIQGVILGTEVRVSSPHPVRDFIYRDDFTALCRTLERISPKGYYLFNGGTGIQTSVGDVVAAVNNLAPGALRVRWGAQEPRMWEHDVWVSDQRLTQDVLGFRPAMNLQQGLQKMISWGSDFLNTSISQGREAVFYR